MLYCQAFCFGNFEEVEVGEVFGHGEGRRLTSCLSFLGRHGARWSERFGIFVV
jgi:hypothetical protein